MRRIGFAVVWSPIRDTADGADNEYHADVVFPADALDEDGAEDYVQALIENRGWLPRTVA